MIKVSKSIYKNQLYSIHFNEQSENEIPKTIPFTLAAKRIKYLGISLPKETKDKHTENNETLMKEIKDGTNR